MVTVLIWHMKWLCFRGLFQGCYWCKRLNPTGIKICWDFCMVGPLVVEVPEMLGGEQVDVPMKQKWQYVGSC